MLAGVTVKDLEAQESVPSVPEAESKLEKLALSYIVELWFIP